MRAEISDILDSQTIQLANTNQQIQLGEELTQRQKDNLAWSEKLIGNSVHLASELDSATEAAGQMSYRLDSVYQALGRVERASTALQTLFALIAIPSRVIDLIHFRLLGLFTMPTALLYFFKPWRYPCMLITLYGKIFYPSEVAPMSNMFVVFIESTISLVGEHEAILFSHTLKLVQWSRAISIFSLQLLRENMVWVSCALLLIMVWIAVEVICKRKKQVSSIFESQHAPIHRDFNRDLTVERRLRSGKPWQPSPDRFRRAATIG